MLGLRCLKSWQAQLRCQSLPAKCHAEKYVLVCASKLKTQTLEQERKHKVFTSNLWYLWTVIVLSLHTSGSWYLSRNRAEKQNSLQISAKWSYCNLTVCHFLVYVSWYRSSAFGATQARNLESEMRSYLWNKRARCKQEFICTHVQILFLSQTPTLKILYQPDQQMCTCLHSCRNNSLFQPIQSSEETG